MEKLGIVWFRSDLRLHDNEALSEALHACKQVIPVYVFEPRFFDETERYALPRTGEHRAAFLLESVQNLRDNLRRLGSELVVRFGPAEEVVFDLARQFRTSWVFCNRERTRDEVLIQDSLEKDLWTIGQEMRYSRGKMLYYTRDLPFPITQTPDSFASFKKEVENFIPIRSPLASPLCIPTIVEDLDAGEIPDLTDLLKNSSRVDSCRFLIGGESKGLEYLMSYASGSTGFAQYDEARDRVDDGTSLLSSYLSLGCLSPKKVYETLCRSKDPRGGNRVTKFFGELLWRDFLRLMGKKHGDMIFLPGGTKGAQRDDLKDDWSRFDRWKNGETGVPLIDACMRKLNLTGFISNRARKLVSSYLINDMEVSWLMGAEYFESVLIDYDPCSNYGNWNYAAGVDSDSYRDMVLNIASQAKKLDPNSSFTKRWVQEYGDLSSAEIQKLYDRAELVI